MYQLAGKRVWVAGHRGMVGSALVRRLASEQCDLLLADRAELDVIRQADVEAFVARGRPDVIIIAAGRVGGIEANRRYPADFLADNLLIAANIVRAAHHNDVERLVYLGSSCIYPKLARQPIDEDALLSGFLEPTNEPYAIAKIAGLKLVEAYAKQHGRSYIAAMPPNLYGPGDRFDLENGHVLAALMRKAHEARERGARELVVWGSGAPMREFMHVDDCANALVYLTKNYLSGGHINVGPGEEISIRDLACLICDVVAFEGEIVHDPSKPDGTPRKIMDSSRLSAMGWAPRIPLRDGIASTWRWYRDMQERVPA